MLEKVLQLKTTAQLVFFLWLIKCMKNLSITGLLMTWINLVFFSDFQFDIRSSPSTADILTDLSYRIARAFNRSGTTRAVALNISNIQYIPSQT